MRVLFTALEIAAWRRRARRRPMRTSDRHDLLRRRSFGICRQAKQVDAGAAVLSDQVDMLDA
jgi:hypothetical protein